MTGLSGFELSNGVDSPLMRILSECERDVAFYLAPIWAGLRHMKSERGSTTRLRKLEGGGPTRPKRLLIQQSKRARRQREEQM